MLTTLRPDQYDGSELCPCCGNDGTGTRYQICAEIEPLGYYPAHDASCALYQYGELCATCEKELPND